MCVFQFAYICVYTIYIHRHMKMYVCMYEYFLDSDFGDAIPHDYVRLTHPIILLESGTIEMSMLQQSLVACTVIL